jgi:hypothetical protein
MRNSRKKSGIWRTLGATRRGDSELQGGKEAEWKHKGEKKSEDCEAAVA